MNNEALHQRNLEIGRCFNDLWYARDPTAWDLTAAGAPFRLGSRTTTREQQLAGEKYLLRALPDCRREVVREAADDDHVIHHWRCSGHHATDGRLVEWEGCTWMRVDAGLIVEGWIFADPADPKLQ